MDWLEERSPHPRRAPLLPASIAFLLVVFGAPAYELASGLLGEEILERPVGGRDVLRGRAARRLEAGLERESRVVHALKPGYNELMYLLFEEIQSAALGKDRWLFSRSVYRQPDPREPGRVAAHVAPLLRLSEFLGEHGCRLCIVPVPVKATIYPEKLPEDAPPPRPHWRSIVEQLDAAGLWVVDTLPAFDKDAFACFYSNNTHWTYQASRAVAEAVATSIRERFADGIPGDPVEGRYRQLEPRTARGDLQRGLGFRPDSHVDRLFLDTYARILGEAVEDGRRMTTEDEQPITLMGTSFSDHYGLGEYLGVALSRRIRDLSRPGKGPMPDMEGLVRGLLSGEVEPPEILVWEWPEKHLFSRAFLPVLQATTRAIHDADRFGDWVATEFPPHERILRRLELTEGEEGVLIGRPTEKDSYVEWRFSPPIPADGRRALRYTVRPSDRARTKVRVNLGKGLVDEPLLETRLRAGRATTLTVPLSAPGDARIHRLRLQVVRRPVPFVLERLELIEAP